MKIETLEQIDHLVKLVVNNKLDALEVDNIRIVKTKHDYQISKPKDDVSDDDILLWSAGS